MTPDHRFLDVNAIRLHYAEAGEGPVVLLCHGWPELWYSWRHQMPALAAAGYRVLAPDMRGYGESGAPAAVEDYTILHLVGDMVGLLDALGIDQAVAVGHDWGAVVAWHAALLRPDRFRAVAAMSVAHTPRAGMPPLEAARRAGLDRLYWLYFQEPGVAERELEADVERSLRRIYHAGSGDVPADWHWRALVPPGGGLLDTTIEPAVPAPWLAPGDLAHYAAAFARSGFRGGLNWYRNIDRNWALMAPFAGAVIRQPALFIAGERDPTLRLRLRRDPIEAMAAAVPGLRAKVLVPGAGHWVQQEAAERVNAELIAFLRGL
jgi:pimeloyl-ACP methyl ester carboxylesterase